MPTIRYSCEVKYENGKVRPKGECANCCVDVTEEEYIKLVQGISEDKIDEPEEYFFYEGNE